MRDHTMPYYHQPPIPNPNPNPNDYPPPPTTTTTTFASAPPYATQYHSSSDFPYPSPYPPPIPDPLPPSAPSYTAPAPSPPPNFYQSFDPHQTPPNYYPSYTPSPPAYVAPPPPAAAYESPYDAPSQAQFDPVMSYYDQGFYNKPPPQPKSQPQLKPSDGGISRLYNLDDEGLNEGVYAYNGGNVEPYGARGTGGSLGGSGGFDDYGRSVSFSSSSSGKDQRSMGAGLGKIVKAVPKVETQQDVKGGVQKFRVKVLPEGSGSSMDVLCQIGLDGIRMLDPSTSRTLRIYPLETITRWDADSSIYTFWSKSSVDIEPRRIRLQSNSYTTSTLLDTVTAATVQLKEMGGKDIIGRNRVTADAGKSSEQQTEKKKGFGDWINLMKPGIEEKDHWVPDEAVTKCTSCGTDFNAFVRKHHCRNCGDIFCDKCTQGRTALTADEQAQPVRVCDMCMAEVTHRLSNAKEAASKSAGLHSHEDLAKKLQEEMDRNRKASSGSKSSAGSGTQMREVACPICTVHLQVQVPTSGSETIECGVCQHPFLVSAH